MGDVIYPALNERGALKKGVDAEAKYATLSTPRHDRQFAEVCSFLSHWMVLYPLLSSGDCRVHDSLAQEGGAGGKEGVILPMDCFHGRTGGSSLAVAVATVALTKPLPS